MSPLPLPVRVAAGLVVSAVEQARDLPRLAVETAAATTADTAVGDTPEHTGSAASETSEATGPNALPGYQELTFPQLRGRLRFLSADDLRALLEWETTHENRAPFVTMLSNR